MGNMRNHVRCRDGMALAGLVFILCMQTMGMVEGEEKAASISTGSVVTRQVVYEVLSSFKQGISNDPLQALASWDTATSPSSSINPCTSNWTGIACEFPSNATVDLVSFLSIDLHNQSLRGSVTPDLALLGPALTYLDLSSNNFSGTLTFLSNFSTLQNLGYLSLAQNNFHGLLTVPPSCFPNLVWLVVAENSLSGPLPADRLSRCLSLQVLNVSNNHFTGSIFLSGLGSNLTATLRALDGGNNHFSGPLPPSIGNCSQLMFLSFPFNTLSGRISSSIGLGCPELKFVSLFSCNLTGDIPKEMRFLSQLTYISIGRNKFTGRIFDILVNSTSLSLLGISNMFITGQLPDDIGSKLPKIGVLDLQDNLLTGSIPKSLGNCSKLVNVFLAANNISGTIPRTIFQARNISQLDLQKNSFSGSIPREIGNLSFLQKAHFNDNLFTGAIPEEVSMLASIQSFSMEHNSLSGNFPNQLFNCTTLIYLTLSDNRFIGSISSSIGFLRSLNEFDASSNQLTGQLPLELSNCTSLSSISLSKNMLSGQIPPSIIRGLSNCLSFQLAHNDLNGSIPDAKFENMIFLQTLDLSHNELLGLVPSGLAGCKDLHSLNLSQNKLGGPIPPGLGGALLSLTDLKLSHNSINGSIPEDLGSLQSLQQLDLSSNALSGTIPANLAKLKGLRLLNLSYNSQLEGVVPVFHNQTRTSFLGDSKLCGLAVNKTCTRDHRPMRSKLAIIIVAASVLLIIMIFILILVLNRKILKKKMLDMEASWDFDPYLRLTLKDIQHATQNFSIENILGVGVTGTVYKGTMRDGTTLAFKKFNLDNSSINSFIGELRSVGLIRHRNLIKIRGYVSNQLDTNILILEYMPNGSLYDHLHGKDQEGLSWDARLRVAEGIAQGLLYLHNDCPSPVIHCDLKPQNILFNESMEVHLTDFGLAKVMAATATSSFTDNMKGTLGYMAPEMAAYGHISRRCDVYSYGILLMELVSGRKPFEEVSAEATGDEDEGPITLVQWIASKLQAGEIISTVDKHLQESIAEDVINQVKELVHLAVQCTQTNPLQRPTMQQVVQELSSTTGSIYKPKRPQAILEKYPSSVNKPKSPSL